MDKPITNDKVIGKVVKVYPKLGVWKKVLTDPKILVFIFITLLLFDFALSYNGNDKKKNAVSNNKKKSFEVSNDSFDKENKLDKKTLVNSNLIELDKELDDMKEIETKDEDLVQKKEKKISKKEKDDELLELTRKIDIDEINKLLEEMNYDFDKKLTSDNKKRKMHLSESKKEDKGVKTVEKSKAVSKSSKSSFKGNSKKEKNILDYTLRLDLNEIQKKINNKIK